MVSWIATQPRLDRLYDFYEHKRWMLADQTGFDFDLETENPNFNIRHPFTNRLFYPKTVARCFLIYLLTPIAILIIIVLGLILGCLFGCCYMCCCRQVG